MHNIGLNYSFNHYCNRIIMIAAITDKCFFFLFVLCYFTVATPKQIRELMKVDGLTNDEVKSHLQVLLSLDCT